MDETMKTKMTKSNETFKLPRVPFYITIKVELDDEAPRVMKIIEMINEYDIRYMLEIPAGRGNKR
jgi:hypothetical protein